jgi:hypothetical protein
MSDPNEIRENLDLHWVQFDFTEAFESDPEAALEAFHLLLLDSVNCAARVAWLRGLEDFADTHLDHLPSLPSDNFDAELQVIRDARLYPAFQAGEVTTERLTRLCCSPDALWAAHCEMMGFTSPSPLLGPKVGAFARLRLSTAFQLPGLLQAAPHSAGTGDVTEEVPIAGFAATVRVISRQDTWQIQIETTHEELSDSTIVVRFVGSTAADESTIDLTDPQLSSDLSFDSDSFDCPLELRKTPYGKFFGFIDVSAKEIASRIKSRSFVIDVVTSDR